MGESTTWASRQEAAFVSGRHDGSAEGKARARMAAGPRRESGGSLEDTAVNKHHDGRNRYESQSIGALNALAINQ